MAGKLTSYGNCPTCNNKVAKIDAKNPQRMFYRIQAILIDQTNGEVIAICSKCKTELEMPVVKMPRKIRKKPHANN